MPITNLYFTNVGPFDKIEFEFDPQVNVFTGPNNSGKSSVLWVLGELLVYPLHYAQRKYVKPGNSQDWRLKLFIGKAELESYRGGFAVLTTRQMY